MLEEARSVSSPAVLISTATANVEHGNPATAQGQVQISDTIAYCRAFASLRCEQSTSQCHLLSLLAHYVTDIDTDASCSRGRGAHHTSEVKPSDCLHSAATTTALNIMLGTTGVPDF